MKVEKEFAGETSKFWTIGDPLYLLAQRLQIRRAGCSELFYVWGLGIWNFGVQRESLKQFPAKNKQWLYIYITFLFYKALMKILNTI